MRAQRDNFLPPPRSRTGPSLPGSGDRRQDAMLRLRLERCRGAPRLALAWPGCTARLRPTLPERRFIEATYYRRLHQCWESTPESHHRFQILSNIPSSRTVIPPTQPKKSRANFESKKQRCYSPKTAEFKLPARTAVDDASDSRHKWSRRDCDKQ